MVKIDENGNKVNVWTESRIDTTTLQVVEVEHCQILATADDTEYWHTRTIRESDESLRLDPTLFIYASEEVLGAIERVIERVADMYDMRSKKNRDEVNIPLSTLMRIMVGETMAEGKVLCMSRMPSGILVLLTMCDMASAEQLRDALFEIFPMVDYIEIQD